MGRGIEGGRGTVCMHTCMFVPNSVPPLLSSLALLGGHPCAAASGVNTVEREGISIIHPAKFIMIGSGNPAEGELRPQVGGLRLAALLGLWLGREGAGRGQRTWERVGAA